MQTKVTSELRAKSLAEPCLLLGVGGHLFGSIACKLPKLATVCIHSQLPLGEVIELLPLAIHEAFRDMMLTESSTEISPSSELADRTHSFIILPPKAGRAFEVIGSKGDFIIFSHVSRTQLVGDTAEPVIRIELFHGMIELWRVQLDKVID